MKEYELNGEKYYCPVELTLKIIGGKWRGLIIWSLRKESKRYSEIKRCLNPVNDKSLSQCLKILVEQEIVVRKSYNQIPPKVEYSLTEKGKELLNVFDVMQTWGSKYCLKEENES